MAPQSWCDRVTLKSQSTRIEHSAYFSYHGISLGEDESELQTATFPLHAETESSIGNVLT
jgi:hypothetical protein